MNSTTKVVIGLAIATGIAVGWACRFQMIPEANDGAYLLNRWTGQVYLINPDRVTALPYEQKSASN